MSIQSVVYNNSPDRGYPGQITDILQPYMIRTTPAQEDLDVAIAVVKGDDIDAPQTRYGFKVIRPLLGSLSVDVIGLTVRVPELNVEPQNDIDGVPVYKTGELVNILETGSMYTTVPDIAIVDGMAPVYFVTDPTTYPAGTLTAGAVGGEAILLDGAYFEKPTLVGDIVKVVIKR
jgi:hypothetical protein